MKFDLSFSRFRKVLFGGGQKDPSCHGPNTTKMVKHTTIAAHLQGFHLTNMQSLQRALINLNNWRIKSTPIKYKAQLIIIFQHHKIPKQDNFKYESPNLIPMIPKLHSYAHPKWSPNTCYFFWLESERERWRVS